MEKLIKIQSELKAPKNQYNAFGKYKYRSQEDILEAVKPLLKENGCSLIISDEVKDSCGNMYVESTVIFKDDSDKQVSVKAQAGIDLTTKGMSHAQCFGASSSYARKYALNGLFLIDDTKDADATNTHGKEPSKEFTTKEIEIIKAKIIASTNEDVLKEIFNSEIRIKTNKELVALITKRKEELLP